MSGNKLTRLHVHADGLIVSKSDTDNQPVKLTLASAETEVTEGEVVGQIDFKSADDGAAVDGIVCASIQAEALSAFNGTDDPTKLSFLTRNSGASTERMVITPQGVGIRTSNVAASVDLAIGESNTGLVLPSAGELAVRTGGNERMRVTNNGVGIRTTTVANNVDLAIGDSDTGLKQQGDGELALVQNGNERMRITTNGVGIRTTSVADNVDLAIGDNDTGFRAHDETTDGVTNTFLAVNTNGQERMRVTNNGVGIRTTTVANNVDLAIGDSDTGLKQQGDGELALVQNGNERMRVTNNGVGIKTQVVHETVDLAIGDSDTGFKTGSVGDQQHLEVITNTVERMRFTNDGLKIGTGVIGGIHNMKLQIKTDPAVAVGSTDFASQNGFGQIHIESNTQRRNGAGTEVGTSKLKIGIEQSPANVTPKAYLQSVCDDISKGQLLLNPAGGDEGGVGIKTTSVASSVDLAIGDSDTGLKQQGDGVLTVVADNVERMRIDNSGLQVTKSGQIADFQGSGTDSGHYIGVSNSSNPTSEARTVAYFGIGGAGFAGQAGDTVISNYSYGDGVQKRIVFDQSGTTRMIIDSTGGVGIRTNIVSSTVDLAVGDSDTGLKQKGDGVLALMTDNLERMRVTNSGVMIGSENTPSEKLDVRGIIRVQNGISNADFFKAYTNDSTGRFFFRWGTLGGDSSTGNYNVHVIMLKNSNERSVGFFENDGDEGSFDFTGQHRSIMNTNYEDDVVGLIASATGQLINLDNGTRATINESLPYCILANSDNDKKVYGVISKKEDDGLQRVYGSGFVATMDKANNNEQRMYINAVGEGGIWVCNKNGAIENGDYVTSSSVVGYGMKQLLNEGLLTNYTVAKLTQDCEFTLTKVVKQKLKVIVGTDAQGNSTSSIDYDANGNVLYEDDLDSEGNQQMVYPLDTRFLLADGTQLVDEADYSARKANGEEVFIACFVGCTYHCG